MPHLRSAAGNKRLLRIADLFQRRLLMVVGKGGVGKTSVACGLALESSRRGVKTLLVEVDGVGRASQLFGVAAAKAGEAVEVGPSLFLMDVEGKAALAEYLMLILPVKRALRAVLNSRIYQYFVAAAPGLKELMTIGKIWYEANRTDEGSGKRRWDLVIVDAPATGHSLQYLGMPQAALETFTTGLVHREAKRVVDLLQDARTTAVVFVATAEEMPVNETIEMYRRVRDDLHLPAGALIVNRVHEESVMVADVQLLASRLTAVRAPKERAFLAEVLARAKEETGWIEINRAYLERLRAAIDLPVAVLPNLFTEEFGMSEIKSLGERLRGTGAGARAATEGAS